MENKENSILKELEAKLITQRKLSGKTAAIVVIVAIFFSLMGLWTNSFGVISAMRQIGLFVAFLLFLIFLLYPAAKNSPRDRATILDWILAMLGAAGGLYTFFFAESFAMRPLILTPNTMDYIFGIITICLILEAARRATGKWISIICLFFLFYAFFGSYFPGVFAHRGFSLERILIRMYLVDEGIYGITGRVAATYIFLFILFGAFLKASGVAEFFNDFALAIAGGAIGGPAKVAVIASAVTGTISGSGVANVATTGSFTIPLMKRMGYKPYFAGAVEAAASSGGLLMPPIMGTAAFVMAEFLGISYVKIIIAGAIPAILYYLAVFLEVHLEALKLGLKGVPKEKLPKIKDVILKRGHLVLPIIILIYTLLSGRSPIFAAFVALLSTVLISQVRKDTRMGIRSIEGALHDGALTVLSAGIACMACGIIIGIVTITGVGQVIAYNILALSHNLLILALFFTMIASLFLSMGLPATACYIVVATICAPALMRMGIAPIVAHFFVFYFGCFSNLTPPVALASYTAAGIAGADPSKVAWTGLRLVLVSFIIPYVAVYNPQLLLQNVQFPRILILLLTTVLAIFSFSITDRGYWKVRLKTFERFIFLGSSILLVTPEISTDITGIMIFITGIIIVSTRARRSKINKLNNNKC